VQHARVSGYGGDRDMVRVLIVDDSPTAGLLLKSILSSDPGIEVLAVASSGEEGIRKAFELDPDLVTMDMHLGVMDGFEATRRILAQKARPIVIVSASLDPNDVRLSIEALAAGALSIIPKPPGTRSPGFRKSAAELISTVKLMAAVKMVGRRGASKDARKPTASFRLVGYAEVLAVGASTGGPAALASILASLPVSFQVPILIVQHITESFDRALAEWLSEVTNRRVELAQHGRPLRAGQVLIAPSGAHLGVDGSRRVILDRLTGPVGGFRPSATYLFQSVSGVYGPTAVGLILTGMGSDGAPGLAALHEAGGLVLAQDAASCVVYGMPAAAAALGIVDRTLDLADIAPALGASSRFTVNEPAE
jgi:two-component system chemotaxis response regulator CheB